MKNLISTVAILSVSLSAFAADPKLQGDREAVDKACASEASQAGCANAQVGSGLLKCIHAYRREHRDFKVSDGCKAAMKQLRADRKRK